MQISEVENLIRGGLPNARMKVEGEGCNFSVTVISEQFEGLTPVKRQQEVLITLKDQLASGELHAVSVKTFTEEEWESSPQNKNTDDNSLIQLG